MAHGLVLKLEEMLQRNLVSKKDYYEITSEENKIIQAWHIGSNQPKFCKLEFLRLMRKTLVFMFSHHGIQESQRKELLKGVAQYFNTFSGILKNLMDFRKPIIDVIIDPWKNMSFSWDEFFQHKTSVYDRKVQNYFATEPEEIVLARVHAFVIQGKEDLAMTLAKCSYLFHSRISKSLFVTDQEGRRVRPQSLILNTKNRRGIASMDWYLFMLQRKNRLPAIVDELKQLTCHEGVQLVHRLRRRIKKNQDFIFTILQILIMQELLKPSKFCCTKKLFSLWCYMHKEKKTGLMEINKAIQKMLAVYAPSSAHFYLFADALWEQFGSGFMPLYVELYVRGLTADVNHLEAVKHREDRENVTVLECHIANVFAKLSTLFSDFHEGAARECMFSAFSLKPTKERLYILQSLTHSILSSENEMKVSYSMNSSVECKCNVRCHGFCKVMKEYCLEHPVLKKGISSVPYALVKDLVTVLEGVRCFQFQYNLFDWRNNAIDLGDYLRDFNLLKSWESDTEYASDESTMDTTLSPEKSVAQICERFREIPSKRKSNSSSLIELSQNYSQNVDLGRSDSKKIKVEYPDKSNKMQDLINKHLQSPSLHCPSSFSANGRMEDAIENVIRMTLDKKRPDLLLPNNNFMNTTLNRINDGTQNVRLASIKKKVPENRVHPYSLTSSAKKIELNSTLNPPECSSVKSESESTKEYEQKFATNSQNLLKGSTVTQYVRDRVNSPVNRLKNMSPQARVTLHQQFSVQTVKVPGMSLPTKTANLLSGDRTSLSTYQQIVREMGSKTPIQDQNSQHKAINVQYAQSQRYNVQPAHSSSFGFSNSQISSNSLVSSTRSMPNPINLSPVKRSTAIEQKHYDSMSKSCVSPSVPQVGFRPINDKITYNKSNENTHKDRNSVIQHTTHVQETPVSQIKTEAQIQSPAFVNQMSNISKKDLISMSSKVNVDRSFSNAPVANSPNLVSQRSSIPSKISATVNSSSVTSRDNATTIPAVVASSSVIVSPWEAQQRMHADMLYKKSANSALSISGQKNVCKNNQPQTLKQLIAKQDSSNVQELHSVNTQSLESSVCSMSQTLTSKHDKSFVTYSPSTPNLNQTITAISTSSATMPSSSQPWYSAPYPKQAENKVDVTENTILDTPTSFQPANHLQSLKSSEVFRKVHPSSFKPASLNQLLNNKAGNSSTNIDQPNKANYSVKNYSQARNQVSSVPLPADSESSRRNSNQCSQNLCSTITSLNQCTTPTNSTSQHHTSAIDQNFSSHQKIPIMSTSSTSQSQCFASKSTSQHTPEVGQTYSHKKIPIVLNTNSSQGLCAAATNSTIRHNSKVNNSFSSQQKIPIVFTSQSQSIAHTNLTGHQYISKVVHNFSPHQKIPIVLTTNPSQTRCTTPINSAEIDRNFSIQQKIPIVFTSNASQSICITPTNSASQPVNSKVNSNFLSHQKIALVFNTTASPSMSATPTNSNITTLQKIPIVLASSALQSLCTTPTNLKDTNQSMLTPQKFPIVLTSTVTQNLCSTLTNSTAVDPNFSTVKKIPIVLNSTASRSRCSTPITSVSQHQTIAKIQKIPAVLPSSAELNRQTYHASGSENFPRLCCSPSENKPCQNCSLPTTSDANLVQCASPSTDEVPKQKIASTNNSVTGTIGASFTNPTQSSNIVNIKFGSNFNKSEIKCPFCLQLLELSDLEMHVLSSHPKELNSSKNHNTKASENLNASMKVLPDVVPERDSLYQKDTLQHSLPHSKSQSNFGNQICIPEDVKNLDALDANVFNTCMDLINNDKDLTKIVDSLDQIDNNYLPFSDENNFFNSALCDEIKKLDVPLDTNLQDLSDAKAINSEYSMHYNNAQFNFDKINSKNVYEFTSETTLKEQTSQNQNFGVTSFDDQEKKEDSIQSTKNAVTFADLAQMIKDTINDDALETYEAGTNYFEVQPQVTNFHTEVHSVNDSHTPQLNVTTSKENNFATKPQAKKQACPYCKLEYRTLKLHKCKFISPEKTKFTCEVCNKVFTVRGNLKVHMLKIHKMVLKPIPKCKVDVGNNIKGLVTNNLEIRKEHRKSNFQSDVKTKAARSKLLSTYFVKIEKLKNNKITVEFKCKLCAEKLTPSNVSKHILLKHNDDQIRELENLQKQGIQYQQQSVQYQGEQDKQQCQAVSVEQSQHGAHSHLQDQAVLTNKQIKCQELAIQNQQISPQIKIEQQNENIFALSHAPAIDKSSAHPNSKQNLPASQIVTIKPNLGSRAKKGTEKMKCTVCSRTLLICSLKKHMQKLHPEIKFESKIFNQEVVENQGMKEYESNSKLENTTPEHATNSSDTIEKKSSCNTSFIDLSTLHEPDIDSSTCLSISDALKRKNSYNITDASSSYADPAENPNNTVKFDFNAIEFSKEPQVNTIILTSETRCALKHLYKPEAIKAEPELENTANPKKSLTNCKNQIYKCEFCLKNYSLKGNLNRHLKKKHNVDCQQTTTSQGVATPALSSNISSKNNHMPNCNKNSQSVKDEFISHFSRKGLQITETSSGSENKSKKNLPKLENGLLISVLKSNLTKNVQQQTIKEEISNQYDKSANTAQNEHTVPNYYYGEMNLMSDNKEKDAFAIPPVCTPFNQTEGNYHGSMQPPDNGLQAQTCLGELFPEAEVFNVPGAYSDLGCFENMLNDEDKAYPVLGINSTNLLPGTNQESMVIQSSEISPVKEIISNVSKCNFAGAQNVTDETYMDENSLKLLIPKNQGQNKENETVEQNSNLNVLELNSADKDHHSFVSVSSAPDYNLCSFPEEFMSPPTENLNTFPKVCNDSFLETAVDNSLTVNMQNNSNNLVNNMLDSVEDVKCRLCGKVFNSITLSKHLKDIHNVPILQKHVLDQCNTHITAADESVKLPPPKLNAISPECNSEYIANNSPKNSFKPPNKETEGKLSSTSLTMGNYLFPSESPNNISVNAPLETNESKAFTQESNTLCNSKSAFDFKELNPDALSISITGSNAFLGMSDKYDIPKSPLKVCVSNRQNSKNDPEFQSENINQSNDNSIKSVSEQTFIQVPENPISFKTPDRTAEFNFVHDPLFLETSNQEDRKISSANNKPSDQILKQVTHTFSHSLNNYQEKTSLSVSQSESNIESDVRECISQILDNYDVLSSDIKASSIFLGIHNKAVDNIASIEAPSFEQLEEDRLSCDFNNWSKDNYQCSTEKILPKTELLNSLPHSENLNLHSVTDVNVKPAVRSNSLSSLEESSETNKMPLSLELDASNSEEKSNLSITTTKELKTKITSASEESRERNIIDIHSQAPDVGNSELCIPTIGEKSKVKTTSRLELNSVKTSFCFDQFSTKENPVKSNTDETSPIINASNAKLVNYSAYYPPQVQECGSEEFKDINSFQLTSMELQSSGNEVTKSDSAILQSEPKCQIISTNSSVSNVSTYSCFTSKSLKGITEEANSEKLLLSGGATHSGTNSGSISNVYPESPNIVNKSSLELGFLNKSSDRKIVPSPEQSIDSKYKYLSNITVIPNVPKAEISISTPVSDMVEMGSEVCYQSPKKNISIKSEIGDTFPHSVNTMYSKLCGNFITSQQPETSNIDSVKEESGSEFESVCTSDCTRESNLVNCSIKGETESKFELVCTSDGTRESNCSMKEETDSKFESVSTSNGTRESNFVNSSTSEQLSICKSESAPFVSSEQHFQMLSGSANVYDTPQSSELCVQKSMASYNISEQKIQETKDENVEFEISPSTSKLSSENVLNYNHGFLESQNILSSSAKSVNNFSVISNVSMLEKNVCDINKSSWQNNDISTVKLENTEIKDSEVKASFHNSSSMYRSRAYSLDSKLSCKVRACFKKLMKGNCGCVKSDSLPNLRAPLELSTTNTVENKTNKITKNKNLRSALLSYRIKTLGNTRSFSSVNKHCNQGLKSDKGSRCLSEGNSLLHEEVCKGMCDTSSNITSKRKLKHSEERMSGSKVGQKMCHSKLVFQKIKTFKRRKRISKISKCFCCQKNLVSSYRTQNNLVTFKKHADILRFLRTHKQPIVKLSRIDDNYVQCKKSSVVGNSGFKHAVVKLEKLHVLENDFAKELTNKNNTCADQNKNIVSNTKPHKSTNKNISDNVKTLKITNKNDSTSIKSHKIDTTSFKPYKNSSALSVDIDKPFGNDVTFVSVQKSKPRENSLIGLQLRSKSPDVSVVVQRNVRPPIVIDLTDSNDCDFKSDKLSVQHFPKVVLKKRCLIKKSEPSTIPLIKKCFVSLDRISVLNN